MIDCLLQLIQSMKEIHVPVSFGEVLDKITILEIKREQIKDLQKLNNVEHELVRLGETWQGSGLAIGDVEAEHGALREVNQRLWDIEDRIRVKEAQAAFDAEFVALARAVYFENDTRAAIKKRVNLKLGSAIMEEKSYASYQRGNDVPKV